MIVSSLFRKFSLALKTEDKHCNPENIEDLRTVQRQIYWKIVQVGPGLKFLLLEYLKFLGSFFKIITVYILHFK